MPQVLKLFHYGRFDIAAMLNAFGATAAPVYCTKIASRLVRTYTDRHGLAKLCAGTAERGHLQTAAIQRLGGRQS